MKYKNVKAMKPTAEFDPVIGQKTCRSRTKFYFIETILDIIVRVDRRMDLTYSC